MVREITVEGALARAVKSSRGDGRLRFVIAREDGWAISLRRVPFQGCYYTNGEVCGFWTSFAASGSDDRKLTHRVDRILGVTRCPDCGERDEQMGHQTCHYPGSLAS